MDTVILEDATRSLPSSLEQWPDELRKEVAWLTVERADAHEMHSADIDRVGDETRLGPWERKYSDGTEVSGRMLCLIPANFHRERLRSASS